MKQTYEANIEKEDEIFSTLVINYTCENTSIICSTNLTIHEAIRKFDIDPSKVSRIIVDMEGDQRTIRIRYML